MKFTVGSLLVLAFVSGSLILEPDACVGQWNRFSQAIQQSNSKLVKIVGSGGFQGLEPYQSGFLISGDGYVLTVWSYVLDSDAISVTVADGQRYKGVLKGYDPKLEIAILKIDGIQLPYFNLDEATGAKLGQKVLAFSNLYKIATGDEPASVQFGIISATCPLNARRGTFTIPYSGPVYVMDAMTNNPGAAGGPVTDTEGQLIGMIGKEVRDNQTNTWLNFAIPIEAIASTVGEIRAERIAVASEQVDQNRPNEPISAGLLGFWLVTEVVSRTPPYIDRVVEESVAGKAGLQADDLIIDVNGRMTPTRRDVLDRLSAIDRDSVVVLTIQRGQKFQTIELKLRQ